MKVWRNRQTSLRSWLPARRCKYNTPIKSVDYYSLLFNFSGHCYILNDTEELEEPERHSGSHLTGSFQNTMTIDTKPFDHADLCQGASWEISDKEALAEQVARIALGYAHHIQSILAGSGVPIPRSATDNVAGAIELLTVEGGDPSHRDGWLFQAISYIAAITQDPNGIFDAPHMQHAAKGLDGLKLEYDASSNSVTSVVIFEDKATKNARTTIATKKDKNGKDVSVWAEFSEIEGNKRQPLITNKISTLLPAVPGLDVDEVIEKIVWKESRKYRVSITVADTHSTENGRKRLFKGYDTVISGKNDRRRAETLHLTDVRVWLDDLAEMAKLKVKEIP